MAGLLHNVMVGGRMQLSAGTAAPLPLMKTIRRIQHSVISSDRLIDWKRMAKNLTADFLTLGLFVRTVRLGLTQVFGFLEENIQPIRAQLVETFHSCRHARLHSVLLMFLWSVIF